MMTRSPISAQEIVDSGPTTQSRPMRTGADDRIGADQRAGADLRAEASHRAGIDDDAGSSRAAEWTKATAKRRSRRTPSEDWQPADRGRIDPAIAR